MTRACKKCGGQVPEDQALNSFDEFFEVLCMTCAAEIRADQPGPMIPQDAPGEPQASPGQEPWQVYRRTPGGPIFQIPEKAALPLNAIFYGYSRPKNGGPVYQLFKFPPKVAPSELDPRARRALEAGGFTFDSRSDGKHEKDRIKSQES